MLGNRNLKQECLRKVKGPGKSSVYVCVSVCVFGQHFLVNTYFIKQYRHPLCTHFRIYTFLGHHQGYVYCKSKITATYRTSPGDSTLQSNSCTASYHPSRKLSKLDELDTRDTAGEVGTSS